MYALKYFFAHLEADIVLGRHEVVVRLGVHQHGEAEEAGGAVGPLQLLEQRGRVHRRQQLLLCLLHRGGGVIHCLLLFCVVD